MGRFPTAAHLVSWAKLSPRAIQSGATSRSGRTGKGNPYLKGVLGAAAASAARTDTFLGKRYRRIVKRRGSSRPSSLAPVPSWSSSGSYWQTQPPAIKISARTTTRAASTRTAEPVATSDSSRHSGSP